MWRNSLVAMLAVVGLALSACGQKSGPSSNSTTYSTSQCAYTSDIATFAYPGIQMELVGQNNWQDIATHATLPCGTKLTVAAQGAADLRFGSQAQCKLRQDPNLPTKTAIVTTRQPANAFFNQGAGMTWCTVTGFSGTIPLCGMGTVFLNGGTTQVQSTCNREPDFNVAVLAGSVRVVDPTGASNTVQAGQQLEYFPSSNSSQEATAVFSPSDVATFQEQANAMGLEPARAPQAITFTSTPPTNPYPGQMYPVTADGGGSGNTVQFTIDQASGKACSIDPQTNIVTFSQPGTCVIDANQAGDSQYLDAPQLQQSITVVPTPIR
jgi:hypothetical protein